MGNTIKISVRNKIAAADGTLYVCGNSDFALEFDFDAEWDEFITKTARFIYGTEYQDIVFQDNVCPVPVISNVHRFYVGVYAGDLRTTTPATVGAKRSILCGGEVPAAPSPDVFGQMQALFNAGLDEARENANAAKAAQTAVEEIAEQVAASEKEAIQQVELAGKQADAANASAAAAALSEQNAKESEEAAAKSAQEAKETVNNAAWVDAEINESGHLILTQSDNFNGAAFTLNENGHLEVAYT